MWWYLGTAVSSAQLSTETIMLILVVHVTKWQTKCATKGVTTGSHLLSQIVWDDIIGEPEGARSPECAWRLSHSCFRHARNWCYTILTVLIAPPCALLLGCGFACLAFEVKYLLNCFLQLPQLRPLHFYTTTIYLFFFYNRLAAPCGFTRVDFWCYIV